MYVINFSFTMGCGRQTYGKILIDKKHELLLTWKKLKTMYCFHVITRYITCGRCNLIAHTEHVLSSAIFTHTQYVISHCYSSSIIFSRTATFPVVNALVRKTQLAINRENSVLVICGVFINTML